jgi:hypothetical protein
LPSNIQLAFTVSCTYFSIAIHSSFDKKPKDFLHGIEKSGKGIE